MQDSRNKWIKRALLGAAAVLLGLLVWFVVRVTLDLLSAIGPPDYDEAAKHVWSSLKFCVGVGGLTCTFVQIARLLIPLRGLYQAGAMKDWFDGSIEFASKVNQEDLQVLSRLVAGLVPESASAAAIGEFENQGSATPMQGGFKREPMDIYDLPIEQLSAQLSLTVESGLDEPSRFPNFLLGLLGAEGIKQLVKLVSSIQAAKAGPGSGATAEEEEASAIKSSSLQAEARTSLSRLAQRKIDAFQISTGGRWRRRLRLWVTACSLLCSLTITLTTHWKRGEGGFWSFLFYSAVAGFLAAYLAMVFRDFIAIVDNLRRRG